MPHLDASFAEWLARLLLCVVASLTLSACSPASSGQSWEHVRDGMHETIYTGDDHI